MNHREHPRIESFAAWHPTDEPTRLTPDRINDRATPTPEPPPPSLAQVVSFWLAPALLVAGASTIGLVIAIPGPVSPLTIALIVGLTSMAALFALLGAGLIGVGR